MEESRRKKQLRKVYLVTNIHNNTDNDDNSLASGFKVDDGWTRDGCGWEVALDFAGIDDG